MDTLTFSNINSPNSKGIQMFWKDKKSVIQKLLIDAHFNIVFFKCTVIQT